jgi:hypothetical protein
MLKRRKVEVYMEKNPAPSERVCYNCRYMLWMVGIGLGVQCAHIANKPLDKPYFPIPSRWYSCEYFKFKSDSHLGDKIE